jgi:aspartyl/asparaginyl beta-hydroxylase (cupin superfamily)
VNATSITEPAARALADAILQVSASQPPAESMKLVDAALARAPNQPIVLNAAGGHMMRNGDARRARELYERAIAVDGGSKVLWLNLATACRSLDDKFLEQELASVRQRHAGADQQRYDACRDVFLRKRRVYTHDPKGFLFPFLPAIEFFRREDFPWLDTLEAATEDIAAEALAALAGDRAGFKPYVDCPASAPMDQWAPLNHSLDWSVYNLLDDGAPVPRHIEKCPKTAAALARLPLCDIPDYAPGAYFSALKPRTRLPAHTGTTNTRSIAHLPLVIPEGCGFRVGSQVRAWQKGKAWVFDDTIDHEAWNDSDQVRIVLIFDIWNPLLTAAERDLVRGFTVSLERYYGADGPDSRSR